MSPRVLAAVWAAAWVASLTITYSRTDPGPVRGLPSLTPAALGATGAVGAAPDLPIVLSSIPAATAPRTLGAERPGEVRLALRARPGQAAELVVFVAGSYTPGAVVGCRLYAEADGPGRGLKLAWEDAPQPVEADGSYGLTLTRPAAELLGRCERGWTVRFVVTAPDGLIVKDKTEWVALDPGTGVTGP